MRRTAMVSREHRSMDQLGLAPNGMLSVAPERKAMLFPVAEREKCLCITAQAGAVHTVLIIPNLAPNEMSERLR